MIDFKTYDIIKRAVIEGIECGWNRSHKYEDLPSKDIIIDNLIINIMNALDEIIEFNKY